MKAQNDISPNQSRDEQWMAIALKCAREAEKNNEVPVGALIIDTNAQKIISTAYNCREKLNSSLGHAEILAIHRASKKLGVWRLTGHTLYVTMEPCIMCSGAIIQSRLDRVVYGCNDPKGGATESLYQILSDPRLNHQTLYTGSILEEDCSGILKSFFKNLRSKKASSR